MLGKEKVKASTSTINLDLKPPYPSEIAATPYPAGYVVPHLQMFDGRKWNSHEHIMRFLDSMGAQVITRACG